MDTRYFLTLLLLFVGAKCNKWWHRLAQRQGPKVCVEERLADDERYFSTPWTDGKLCGAEMIVRFSCCHGYDKVAGERGCPLVLPLTNLVETGRSIGADKFMDYAEFSGLLPLLSNRGAFTVFVTRDSAFNQLTTEQEKAINGSKSTRSQPPVLLFTIVNGRRLAEELHGTLATHYRQASIIVTRFPSGLVTVNCVPLVLTDLEATNGFLHVTEKLLLPSGHATITDMLVRTPELSTMATAVVRAQLGNELKGKGPFTLFAPVDSAWESFPQAFMEGIMEDTNSIRALLQHHMVDFIWCSAAFGGDEKLRTLEGTTVRLWCNESGQFIDDARLLEGDHPAGNGFIHQIDTVLIPDKVRSLSDLMQVHEITYFLKMAEIGGLSNVLQRSGTYTVFAPCDEAFKGLSNETLAELMSQSSVARSVVNFHVSSGRHLTTNFVDGQRLSTLKGQQAVLRIKYHRKLVTLESSLVTSANIEARNGILHILDRIMLQPTLTVVQVLENGNYSTFLSILNQTEPNLLKTLSNTNTTYTVFAPDDETFNQTPPGFISRLMADPPLLFQMAAHHVVESFIVSGGMIPRLTYEYKDINGSTLVLKKEDGEGSLTVANMATVEDPEIMATNGIVHRISRFLQF